MRLRGVFLIICVGGRSALQFIKARILFILKLLREFLPLSDPFPKVWQKGFKIINRLHLSNHTWPECSVLYNPNREGLENVKQIISD